MPDFGDEPHVRRLEWIFAGDFDVNLIAAAFVWSVGRTSKMASEVSEIGDVGLAIRGSDSDAGVRILDNILDLLDESAMLIRHRAG